MRAVIIALSLAALTLGMGASCNEGADNDGKTVILQDSMINVFPTWQALKIKVEDNRTEMTVVIGDATFYTAPDAQKSKKAEELAKMIMRIYGAGNYLEKGKLIVTKNVQNTEWAPADGIELPMDFSALKNATVK